MKPTGKISTGLLFILIGLAVVVMLTTCAGCSNVMPYNARPKYASAEGFRPVHYASYPDGNAVDIKDRHLIDSTASQPTDQRVPKMKGLFGPDDKDKVLDSYSRAKGGLSEDCMMRSSGLSNSQGYLCLDDKQIEMLKTRGGNQSGCASPSA